MKITFNGIYPDKSNFKLGVANNNLVDKLEFIVDQCQDGTDLAKFRPYLKIVNAATMFADRTPDLKSVADEVNSKLHLCYIIPRKVTQQKAVEMQLQYEDYTIPSILVWQSAPFGVRFAESLPADRAIENAQPTILQDQQRQINELKTGLQTEADERAAADTAIRAEMLTGGTLNGQPISKENGIFDINIIKIDGGNEQ